MKYQTGDMVKVHGIRDATKGIQPDQRFPATILQVAPMNPEGRPYRVRFDGPKPPSVFGWFSEEEVE